MREDYLRFRDTDNTIYYGDCHCYHCSDIKSNDCLKRYFTCLDKQLNTIRVAVCNSFIRIKIHNKMNDEGNGYSPLYYGDTIREIVSEATGHNTSYYNIYNQSRSNLLGRTFRLIICDKPIIISSVNLVDAIKVIIELDSWHPNIIYITQEILDDLRAYVKLIKPYIKYKKNYNIIQTSLNKLDKGNMFGCVDKPKEYSLIMRELLEAIINQKTKQLCNQ